MGILLAEAKAGVCEVTPGGVVNLPIQMPWPSAPCVSAAALAVGCPQTRACVCLSRNGYEPISRMPAVPGLSELCLSPCSRYLYQLSAEADCVHTRAVATGDLLYAAKTGVFPRMMRLSSDGRRLLVAGGAEARVYVLSAPDLGYEAVLDTRHPCFGADFWADGLALVCAKEGQDIQTAVYTLSPGRPRPRLVLELDGQPGGFCVCPNGTQALLSFRGGLILLDLRTGAPLWNRPEWALCMRLCCKGQRALASETLDGRAYLFAIDRPWESRAFGLGVDTQACFT